MNAPCASGFSHHNVPSLSKVATLAGDSTKPFESVFVTVSTKSTMACFAAESTHEDNVGLSVTLLRSLSPRFES